MKVVIKHLSSLRNDIQKVAATIQGR